MRLTGQVRDALGQATWSIPSKLVQNALAKNTVTFAEEGNEVRAVFDSTVNVEVSRRC